MSSINKVLLVGRVTKDVQLRTTTGGTSVTDFNIAVDGQNATSNDAQDKSKQSTYFFKVTAWNKNAEFCAKYLKMGDLVGVDGSLIQRTFENKAGFKQTVTDINATRVTLLAHKTEKNAIDVADGFIPDAEPVISNPTDQMVDESKKDDEDDLDSLEDLTFGV